MITEELNRTMDKENNFVIDGQGNIIINDVDGSTITINPDNSEEIRRILVEFGGELKKLPLDVIKILEENQKNNKMEINANVYLTTLAELGSMHRKLKFGLTITNLTKEHRYFNQPTFKVFPKFNLGNGLEHDTFALIHLEEINLPKRLEYGEPFSLSFTISDGFIEMCKDTIKINEEGYIQAFVSTTVGELYESKKFKFKKLFEHLKWLQQ